MNYFVTHAGADRWFESLDEAQKFCRRLADEGCSVCAYDVRDPVRGDVASFLTIADAIDYFLADGRDNLEPSIGADWVRKHVERGVFYVRHLSDKKIN